MKILNTTRSAGLFGASMLAIATVASSPARAQDDVTQPDATSPQARDQQADPSPNTDGLPDIVVTAQKRSQSINSVGMAVQAISGDALVQRGITSTAELTKAVPGFSYSNSGYSSPVYTLRGVGLNDYSLGAQPSVAVYLDEAPLTFPNMTAVSPLDVQQVEVLKGPQGILFGQSSTGGAINYIAAKPTAALSAGGNATHSNFGQTDLNGFVSGPLTDTLGARLAVHFSSGGAWQYSTTRDDELGNSDVKQARILLDWQPSSRLKFTFNVNGFLDGSDTQAGQLSVIRPVVPALAAPELLNHPIVLDNNRAADWDPNFGTRKNDKFIQGAVRADYELTDVITITSLSAVQHFKADRSLTYSGVQVPVSNARQYGRIDSLNQELRISGSTDRLHWLAGGTYEHAHVIDNVMSYIPETSANQPIPGLPRLVQSIATLDQKMNNYGLFANAEYKLDDHLSAFAGLRYTATRQNGTGCTIDGAAGNQLGTLFTALQQIFSDAGLKTSPVVPIGQNDCIALDSQFNPTAVHSVLNESNMSYRAGLNYKLDSGTLFYGNFRRGYKAGLIPNIPSSSTLQSAPVRQEKVDAWEVGFKTPLFDRKLQLNGSAFYYDYADKQVASAYIDPIFGQLTREFNVPSSRIWGIEGEIEAHPFPGLSLSANATYLSSKVTGDFNGANQQGYVGNFRGSPLPYTPKFSAVSDIQYVWALSDHVEASVGGTLTYRSADNSNFHTAHLPAPDFALPSYALVDLRASIAAPDGAWQIMLWGRNVTNKYYWNTVYGSPDAVYRYSGRPATYGMTLSFKL